MSGQVSEHISPGYCLKRLNTPIFVSVKVQNHVCTHWLPNYTNLQPIIQISEVMAIGGGFLVEHAILNFSNFFMSRSEPIRE
jgi:hypothetical protein